MLSNFYPPFIGGEEVNVRSVSIALAARGHAVSVCTLRATGLPSFEVDEGVRIHRVYSTIHRLRPLLIDKDRPHLPPIADPEVVRALRRVITEERPQVVHAHNWMVHSFLPLKRWSGAKLVMGLHDYGLECANTLLMRGEELCSGPAVVKCLWCASAFYGPAKGIPIALANFATSNWERQLVDLFIPVSEAVASGNGLLTRNLPYHAIPNFVSIETEDQGSSTAERVAALPDGPFLLYVGAFAPHKGVDVLLRAYGYVRATPHNRASFVKAVQRSLLPLAAQFGYYFLCLLTHWCTHECIMPYAHTRLEHALRWALRWAASFEHFEHGQLC